MSWSFHAVGKAEAVVRAIEESPNNKMGEPSLSGWNEAKPALLALVGANVGNVAVKVIANGHASFEIRTTKADSEGTPIDTERVKTSGQCSCVIESLYGFVQ